jgi:RNA polymerase sigma-70 factor, ECF subfamily
VRRGWRCKVLRTGRTGAVGADFEEFYVCLYPRLWAYLTRTTRERALAEELTQESFVRLLASRGAFLSEDARRAYLFRIAENLARDAGRRRVRERTTSLEVVRDPPAPPPQDPISRRAAEALAALGERDRKLLWLAHVEDWKHSEIAGVFGLATGSVRVLLHRARRRLQKLLEKKEIP